MRFHHHPHPCREGRPSLVKRASYFFLHKNKKKEQHRPWPKKPKRAAQKRAAQKGGRKGAAQDSEKMSATGRHCVHGIGALGAWTSLALAGSRLDETVRRSGRCAEVATSQIAVVLAAHGSRGAVANRCLDRGHGSVADPSVVKPTVFFLVSETRNHHHVSPFLSLRQQQQGGINKKKVIR